MKLKNRTLLKVILVLLVALIFLSIYAASVMRAGAEKDKAEFEQAAVEKTIESIQETVWIIPTYVEESDEIAQADLIRDISVLPAGTIVSPEEIGKKAKKWFEIRKIKKGDDVYNRIYGKSFPTDKDAKIKLKDLRYIHLLHYNFDGEVAVGELIVNKEMAKDIRDIVFALYKKKYQIYSM